MNQKKIHLTFIRIPIMKIDLLNNNNKRNIIHIFAQTPYFDKF